MKTRLFLPVLLLCISYHIAQASVGFKIGGNYTYFKNNDIHAEPALTYGITTNIKLTKRTALSLEFLINRKKGNVYSITEGPMYHNSDTWVYNKMDLNIRTVFIEIPVLLKFKLYNNKKYKYNFFVGPSLSIGLWDKSMRTYKQISATDINNSSYDYLPADQGNRLTSNGINWNLGAEIIWRRYSLELRYAKSNFELEMIDDLWFHEKLSHSIYMMGGIHF